ncbi:unnamed protein product [Closterium sp. Naga37s-1]|nr:unnamed protein product [Closterium sp. Naga37s-1]
MPHFSSIPPSNSRCPPFASPSPLAFLFLSFPFGLFQPLSFAPPNPRSPPGYYIRRGRGAGRANWHVHLPVGAWCGDERSCAKRSLNLLGSSTPWAAEAAAAAGRGSKKVYPAFTGLLSSSAAFNPAFHAWNLVRPVYCDGGGYTGTRGRMDVAGNKSLYLDGWNIVQAVLQGGWLMMHGCLLARGWKPRV